MVGLEPSGREWMIWKAGQDRRQMVGLDLSRRVNGCLQKHGRGGRQMAGLDPAGRKVHDAERQTMRKATGWVGPKRESRLMIRKDGWGGKELAGLDLSWKINGCFGKTGVAQGKWLGWTKAGGLTDGLERQSRRRQIAGLDPSKGVNGCFGNTPSFRVATVPRSHAQSYMLGHVRATCA